jgi:DNA-binding PadR family transcriptional regulator
LACEYQRRPLRRTDISEKVLSKNDGRSFKSVFNAAQQQLRAVFGMELVELPAREKITLQQKRAAQKSTSQGSKTATQWILTSILPNQFRDPAILQPAVAPTGAAEGTYTALYTLLVALIMLGGVQIPQAKMERYLRRLGLEDRTPVAGSEKTEKLLKRLEKEGYIREIREKAMQGEEDVSYIVGPRGKVEVGRVGVEGLVTAVYGDVDGVEEEELERRIARSLGMGEGPPRPVQNGEGRRERGRPRQDAEEEQEGSGSEEDEEGDELYE